MKRYYSKEHNRLMLSPKVEKPYERLFPDCECPDCRELINEKESYNEWLSKGLEIVGEHNWKDLQEVVEGVDYVIEERWNPIQQSVRGIIYQPGLYAIPKKEKENYVPNVQATNEASVASHSCTEGNSAEQVARFVRYLHSEFKPYGWGWVDKYRFTFQSPDKEDVQQTEEIFIQWLNRTPNDAVSDTTEAK